MIDESELRTLGQRLCEVDGVVAVLLGGSRARGEHTPESDFDLGLYYRSRLDIVALQVLAREVAGIEASMTVAASGDRGRRRWLAEHRRDRGGLDLPGPRPRPQVVG